MLGSYEVLGFVRGKGKGFFMFFPMGRFDLADRDAEYTIASS